MTSEKITAASGMAAVSTSSEVFMGQIQSIIDSKNKEATNKFASQGAKLNQNHLFCHLLCVILITMTGLRCPLL